MIRVLAAERCLLSCCPGVFPTGMLLAITGCQLGEGILNWSNLGCSLSWLLYLSIKEEERGVCPCDVYLLLQKLTWFNSGASVCYQPSKHVTATVENPRDSYALI